MMTGVTVLPATLDRFNTAPAAPLTAELTELFGSDALAAAVVGDRPYPTVDALCVAASDHLADLPRTDVLAAVDAHPPIGAAVSAGSRSASEQSSAVADAATDTGARDLEIVRHLQTVYRERFGWNFLIRAAGRSGATIRAELERRLTAGPDEEWEFSAGQLNDINLLRLRGAVTENPVTSVTLSIHCLDTTTGLPARGLQVELVALEVTTSGPDLRDEATVLESATTDDDGRYRFVTAVAPGTYRLRFRTGEYLASRGTDTLYPWVDVTFAVDDPASTGDAPSHLHIPLLLNPFGYSTYRGS